MDSDTETQISLSPGGLGADHNLHQADNKITTKYVEHDIDVASSRSSSSCSVIEDSQKQPSSTCSFIEESQKDVTINVDEAKNEKIERTISRNLLNINAPEKIVLCIDTSEDRNHTPFKLGDGTKYAPLYMIKRVTEIFLHLKNSINKLHEFALVVLQGNKTTWVRDFTSDPRMIINELEKLTPTEQEEVFDLSQLFDVLRLNIHLPPIVSDPTNVGPAFVPRVILLYSRSTCMPAFLYGRDSFIELTRCVYFTLDVIYIHEEVSGENKCEEIFRVLAELDHEGFSYMFHVLRNATKLHDYMAKLLAHPLQRPLQKQAAYKLENV